MHEIKQVLVVDDEEKIRKLICLILQKEGLATIESGDGLDAIEKYKENGEIDAVILDVMLPGLDGFSVCKEIKKIDSDARILILTAKDSEEDELSAFESGANDYVSKPFSLKILLARTLALIDSVEHKKSSRAEAFECAVDKESLILKTPHNTILLTPLEARILHELMLQVEAPIARDNMARILWDSKEKNTRLIDTHVKNLRAKLDGTPLEIKSIRGVGYALFKR